MFASPLRRGSMVCAAVTAVLSGLALVGWILQVEILKRLLPGLPPMKANAAVCYLLGSLSLAAYTRSAPRSHARRAAAAAAAAVMVVVGAATLAEYAFGWRLGIDQFLFGDRALATAPHPGRPSTNAALGFGLLGVGLLCWEVRIGRWWVTSVLAWCVAPLGLLALIGYTSGTESLISFTGDQQIAPNSAVAVSVLALGILLARLDRGEMALLASGGPGGMVLRRLLAVAIGLPIALATFTLAGRQIGLWSEGLSEWVFASGVTVMLAGLGWMIAGAVSRADAQRSRVEGMMRAIAETASDAILTVDGSGVITYANPALEGMFGYEEGTAVGQPAATMLPDSERPAQLRQLAGVLHGGDLEAVGALHELTGVRRDGREFPIEVSRAVWDADGEPVATVIIRDASERHRAERRLHGLLESAPDAIIVANAAGEILVANARAEAVFGYSREVLIGSPVERLLPTEKQSPHAALRRQYLADPQPRHGRRPGEFTARRGDGSVFPAEITLNPIHTEDGLLVSAAIRDITERTLAERATGQLAAIVASSAEAVIGVNRDGTIESWNASAERLYGYSASEAIGQPIAIVKAPEDAASNQYLSAGLAGARAAFDADHVRRDGTRVEVAVTISPIHDRAGAVIGASCLVQDVSERKRAERELQRLAQAAEYGTDAVISIDRDGRVQRWNRGAERLYGFRAQDVIGQDAGALLGVDPERSQDIAPILAGERSLQYEARRRRQDGSIIELLVTVTPWRSDGMIVGVSEIAVDITERRRAEQASARLAAIVESSEDAIIGKTLEGKMTSWNAAAERIYGYVAGEAIGQHISMLLPPGEEDELDALLARVAAGESVSHLEGSRQRKDGRLIDVSVSVSPICDRDGRVIGASTIARDITERKQDERELARLADAAELGTDAVISIDLDAHVCHWNAGAERLYGYSAQEAIGQSLYELTAFTDEPHQEIAKMVAGEAVYQIETQRRRKDGAILDVLLTISPWRVDGRVVGVTGIAIDLTDRKRSERARERALADLREAQRIARIGSWRWDPRRDRVTWSQQTYEIYGRDPALGPVSTGEVLGYVHPEDRESAVASMAGNLGGAAAEHDQRIIRPDGTQRIVRVIRHPDPDRPGCYQGTVQDVTEQRQAETELRHSEERMRTIFEGAPIGVALVDAHLPYTLLRANPALAEMLGADDPEELVGRPALTLLDRPQRAAAETQLQRLLDRHDRCLATEVQLRGPGGDPLWVAVNAAVVGTADAAPEHLVLHLQDVTERKQYEHQLRLNAERDPLTGLLNRRAMDEQLDRLAAENSRYGTPVTLMVCDLDNLKLVNDTLGHKAGDELLIGVARALGERLRETDVLARMGGDEFALLLGHTGLDQARLIAERLRAAILELNLTVGRQPLHTTLSIGIAPLGEGISTAESLVAADLAMYEAKRHGRNRVAIARQAFSDDSTTMQLGWLERLHSALTHGHFELHAQPITELRTGRVSCLELLLRLREPDGELLMPAAFIPTAERFGLIADIDRWVVREAIRILAQDPHNDTAYTINLSGVSVGDPELLGVIEHEITTAGVDPSRLIFEFTETAAMSDLSAAREFTHELTRLGCRSAIDDFGSGFGAFSYLKHLPVNYLKIDGEFIRNLPGSTDDRVLVKAIIDVARGLRKHTIAEFVSSDEAVALLRDYGADYAQGFHLGAPEPLAQAG